MHDELTPREKRHAEHMDALHSINHSLRGIWYQMRRQARADNRLTEAAARINELTASLKASTDKLDGKVDETKPV